MTARAKIPGVIILALSLLVGALAMLQSTAYGATSLAQKPQCKPHGQYAHPKKKC
jgi:hypothetical protein